MCLTWMNYYGIQNSCELFAIYFVDMLYFHIATNYIVSITQEFIDSTVIYSCQVQISC